MHPLIRSYLAIYLREQGYGDEFIRKYEWRSYPVRRHFGDIPVHWGWYGVLPEVIFFR